MTNAPATAPLTGTPSGYETPAEVAKIVDGYLNWAADELDAFDPDDAIGYYPAMKGDRPPSDDRRRQIMTAAIEWEIVFNSPAYARLSADAPDPCRPLVAVVMALVAAYAPNYLADWSLYFEIANGTAW